MPAPDQTAPIGSTSWAHCPVCDWRTSGKWSHVEAKAHAELNMHPVNLIEKEAR